MKYRKYEVRLYNGEIYIALEDPDTRFKDSLLCKLDKAKIDQVIKMQILGYRNPRLFEPVDLCFGGFQKELKEYKREKAHVDIETIYVIKRNIYLIADRGVKEVDELNGNTDQ